MPRNKSAVTNVHPRTSSIKERVLVYTYLKFWSSSFKSTLSCAAFDITIFASEYPFLSSQSSVSSFAIFSACSEHCEQWIFLSFVIMWNEESAFRCLNWITDSVSGRKQKRYNMWVTYIYNWLYIFASIIHMLKKL